MSSMEAQISEHQMLIDSKHQTFPFLVSVYLIYRKNCFKRRALLYHFSLNQNVE